MTKIKGKGKTAGRVTMMKKFPVALFYKYRLAVCHCINNAQGDLQISQGCIIIWSTKDPGQWNFCWGSKAFIS
jgi:hypothetical protein